MIRQTAIYFWRTHARINLRPQRRADRPRESLLTFPMWQSLPLRCICLMSARYMCAAPIYCLRSAANRPWPIFFNFRPSVPKTFIFNMHSPLSFGYLGELKRRSFVAKRSWWRVVPFFPKGSLFRIHKYLINLKEYTHCGCWQRKIFFIRK